MFELYKIPRRPLMLWLHGIELGLASFRKLIALTTVLAFLSLLPTIYMAMIIGDTEISPDSMVQLFRQGHFVFIMLILQLLGLILSSFVYALIIGRLDAAARGSERAHELRTALQKLLSLVSAAILGFITVVIGLGLAFLAGILLGAVFGTIFGRAAALIVTEGCIFIALIYIAVNLLFFQFAVVLDGKGPVGALNLSCALVFRNWWRTFTVLLAIVLTIMAIVVLIILPLAVAMPLGHWLPMFTAMDTGRTLLVKGVFKLIGAAILMPFMLGILYTLYHDLKLRHTLKSASIGSIRA